MNSNLGPNAQTLHLYNLEPTQQCSSNSNLHSQNSQQSQRSQQSQQSQKYNRYPPAQQSRMSQGIVQSQQIRSQQEQKAISQQFSQICAQIYNNEQLINNMMEDISYLSLVDFKRYRNQNKQFGEDHVLDLLNFYPKFLLNTLYLNDQEKKMVVFSDRNLNNMLASIEKANAKLKEELKGYYFQFSKTTLLTQKLLIQNKSLRKMVSKTNNSIKTLMLHLQQQSKHNNPEMQTSSQQLNRLKQENGVLCEHYKKLKNKKKLKESQEIQLNGFLLQKNKERSQLENQSRAFDDEDQHNGKSIVLQSQNKQQTQLRQKHLLSQKQRLQNWVQQLQNDKNSLQHCSSETTTQLNSYFEKSVPMLQQYRTQHTQSLQNVQDLEHIFLRKQRQLRDAEQQFRQKQQKLCQYLTINRKLDRKYNQYLAERQKKEQKRVKLENQEAEVGSFCDLKDIQIQEFGKKIEEKKLQIQKKLRKGETDVKNSQKMRQNYIENWKGQLLVSKKNYNVTLLKENHEINLQQMQIEDLNLQIKQTNQHVQELLDKIRSLNQKQDIVQEMRSKVYSKGQSEAQGQIPLEIQRPVPLQMQVPMMQGQMQRPMQIMQLQGSVPLKMVMPAPAPVQVQVPRLSQLQGSPQMQNLQTQGQIQGSSERIKSQKYYPIESTPNNRIYTVNPESLSPTNLMQIVSQIQSPTQAQHAKSTPRTSMQTERSPVSFAQTQSPKTERLVAESPRGTKPPIQLRGSRSPKSPLQRTRSPL